MIPRYQMVLFILLLAASLAMGGVLWHLRERAHQRLLAGEDSSPTSAPQVSAVEEATLMVADDSDDSLQARVLSLPLPPGLGERARAILGRLLDLYAAAGSSHPVPGGAAGIAQVFLLPAGSLAASPGSAHPTSADPKPAAASQSGSLLAVVNFTGAFAASHPSGIETENLTLLSISATLRANLPRVTEVRFLVDGQPRATLADHADLTQTYLTAGLTSGPIGIPANSGADQ